MTTGTKVVVVSLTERLGQTGTVVSVYGNIVAVRFGYSTEEYLREELFRAQTK